MYSLQNAEDEAECSYTNLDHCPAGSVLSGDICVFISDPSYDTSWNQANSVCAASSGRLASLKVPARRAIFNVIDKYFINDADIFIGLTGPRQNLPEW